jgi:hypothetical protein
MGVDYYFCGNCRECKCENLFDPCGCCENILTYESENDIFICYQCVGPKDKIGDLLMCDNCLRDPNPSNMKELAKMAKMSVKSFKRKLAKHRERYIDSESDDESDDE